MKNTVHNLELTYGLNISHRKENHFMEQYSLIHLHQGEFKEAACLRIYGTQAMNYACLWIHAKEEYYGSGSGSAGGYGYHRPSQAAMYAFNAAGIYLKEDISGRGDSAIEDAIRALASKLKIKKYFIHKSHA